MNKDSIKTLKFFDDYLQLNEKSVVNELKNLGLYNNWFYEWH